MTTKDFTANVISASKVVPDGNFKDSKASGIWDINEALDLIKGGNWPNAANINPEAFVGALFQTHVYDGSNSTLVINNGINLSGKDGLTWIKSRSATEDHFLFSSLKNDSNQTLYLKSNLSNAASAINNVSQTSTGFSLPGGDGETNQSGGEYVSWTFRKQPKFFDIVKYEGTGSARTVSHSLNSTVGMILIKNLDVADPWAVYHRGNTGSPQTDYLILNEDEATVDNANWWNDTAPTSSVFTVGTDHSVNASGENYVAYLFAHNNDDGGFGASGDQDIIKCGSYEGNDTSGNPGVVVDLGFEPQWLMIKNYDNNARDWVVVDVMRGFYYGAGTGSSNTTEASLVWNENFTEANASSSQAVSRVDPLPNGFVIRDKSATMNENESHLYVAIRRGGMPTPTTVAEVFNVTAKTTAGNQTTTVNSGFITDFALVSPARNSGPFAFARQIGDNVNQGHYYLRTAQDNALRSEGTDYGVQFDHQDGIIDTFSGAGQTACYWQWRRATGFFDTVHFTGTGSARTIAHNLGVAPEMMWVKDKDAANSWAVYYGDNTDFLILNDTAATADDSRYWNDTTPTSTVFSVGTENNTNASGNNFIAFLFATLAGISKFGSFTQSGATNVDCGFTGDTPSLIIFKRTDDTGNWYLFDSARGIVAGNDKSLYLDETGSEVTNADIVDPYSGGFATTSNLTNGSYIFYAVAAQS